MRFAHLSTRLFNRPLVIHEPKAEILMNVLLGRIGIGYVNGRAVAPAQAWYDEDGDDDARESLPGRTYETKGYDVEFGIARIDIEGTLVAKLGSLRPYSGMVGYDGIRQNLVEAMNDPDVRAVWFDIDSPGGEVAGCRDLCDLIYSFRGKKPMWAILNECAFSAGYWIASACDVITVPRTGGVGSIGVVWMHCDFSQALGAAGIKVTFVKRGSRKVDGAPEIPLSDEALARFQKEIDTVGEMFEADVARNRGLSAEKIRDMNAGTFLGVEGVSLGLADVVLAPDAAFRALLEQLG